MKYKFSHALDAPERTMQHADIIRNKRFLKELYRRWYQILFDEMPDYPQQKIIELGSGGGFLKELAPNIITSDYLNLPVNDMSFSALDMPFEDSSLDGVFMIDTFHHLSDATKFLNEALRTLRPGAKIIMVEPANSLWGRWIYQNFHHEPFDPSAGWTIPESGPLSGANGALPWIVFERDKKLFYDRYPEFEITRIKYHTPLIYLLSGGVSHSQLMPDFSYGFFNFIDKLAFGLSRNISMFMTIILIKKEPFL